MDPHKEDCGHVQFQKLIRFLQQYPKGTRFRKLKFSGENNTGKNVKITLN